MKNSTKTVKQQVRARRRFTATEKCQAVLQIWTEKTTPAQLAKELGLTWALLTQWQDLAMSGMLAALEPKNRQCPKPSPLSVRLQQLLEKKTATKPAAAAPSLNPNLVKRLAEHQQKPQEKSAEAAS